MKYLVILLILVILLLLSLVPIFGNNNSLLRRCRFNERTGNYDVCKWFWDSELKEQSIYF